MRKFILDALVNFVGWAPELILLLTDLAILVGSGHGDQVAGASVAGILLGAIGRLVRAPSSVTTKMAERYSRHRVALLTLNYIWATAGVGLLLLVWSAAAALEDFVGLKGCASYLAWAVPANVLIRLHVPGYIACATNLRKPWGRALLPWLTAAINVPLTWWLADRLGMGAEGAALATFISLIPESILFVYWAHKEGVVGWKVDSRLLRLVLRRSKAPISGACFAFGSSVAAVFLNKWLGKELAKEWTYLHVACDVVGGVGICIWWSASKHYTLHLSDEVVRSRIWRAGDRAAIVLVTVGLWGSWIYTGGLSILVVLWFCLTKRQAFLRDREATDIGFRALGRGKVAYATCCVVGYGGLVLVAQPNLGAAVVVYCVAQTAQYMAMRK
jgi:hypothetical protein